MLRVYNFNGGLDEISLNYIIFDDNGILKNTSGERLYE